MITTEEWKRRNKYSDERRVPEPCQCCRLDVNCLEDPDIQEPDGIDADLYYRCKIPAALRYGYSSPVGYPYCLRANLWLLGLDHQGVMESPMPIIDADELQKQQRAALAAYRGAYRWCGCLITEEPIPKARIDVYELARRQLRERGDSVHRRSG